jgi:hypothetical protein
MAYLVTHWGEKPNPKSQNSNKLQGPKTCRFAPPGIWSLEFVWDLDFEILGFDAPYPPDKFL